MSKEVVSIEINERFRVVQIADAHIAEDYLETFLEQTEIMFKSLKPDLVIFTGDNVLDSKEDQFYQKINSLCEKYNVLWAMILGNHDAEYTDKSREDLMLLCSKMSKCITPAFSNNGRYGDYILKLKVNSKVIAEIIGLDTGDYLEEPKRWKRIKYAGINDEQVDWYLENTESRARFVYLHIPIKEYEDAYRSISEMSYLYGNIRENKTKSGRVKIFSDAICKSHKRSSFFKKANDGSLKAIFAGHDHINDAHFKLKGVDLIFGQKTGHCGYNNKSKGFVDNNGYTVLNIAKDSTYEIEVYLFDEETRELIKAY